MTDRQVTESTIGLAGRLSHVPYGVGKAEDRGWQSTRNFAQHTPVFKELGPRKAWFPVAGATGVPSPGSPASTAWQASQKQKKWLLKAHPEARLGNEYIHDELLPSHSSPELHRSESRNSSLFSIGELTDTSEPRKVSSAPLIAIAAGDANDVLRLIKPSVEEWQWSDDGSVSLQLTDITENGESSSFKDELVGPIRRVKSVVDSKRYDPTRWVIVQRDSGTQVFQPEYQSTPTASRHSNSGIPSRIAANPLFSLSKEKTGGIPHSDACFNPGIRSRPRQLGLIDECGFWSIWDVAHTKARSGKPRVSLSICGHIEKGVLSRLPSKTVGEAQWHKILWVNCPGSSSEDAQTFGFEEDPDVSDVHGPFPQLVRCSTLVLCSQKLVRLLDLTNNLFFPDLPLVGERGGDYILDVHANPQDTQYIFVLTTSKLFIIRAYSAPGQDWGETRKTSSIVLAVSHLRDAFDRSLKLAISAGAASSKQATSLVSIYSGNNAQVDLFYIVISKSDPSSVAYHHEASVTNALQRLSLGTGLRTICLHPASVILKPSNSPTQLGRSLAKQQVRFYQLAILTIDMRLIFTLCVSSSTLPVSGINGPDRKRYRTRDPSKARRKMLKHLSTRFVVSDDISRHTDEGEGVQPNTISLRQWPVMQRPMGVFYEYLSTLFGGQLRGSRQSPPREEAFGSNPFDYIHFVVERAVENEILPATTLFEMADHFQLPRDLAVAATEWGVEIERLRRAHPSTTLISLNQPHSQVTGPINSLQGLYSTLLDATAGAKFTGEGQGPVEEARLVVLQRMACDLYLSLLGLVRRQVDAQESQQSLAHNLENMAIDSQPESRAASSSRSQSEVPAVSQKRSKSEPPQGEDAAMVLLRAYTGTGKFVPVKRTALLDKWEVGASPGKYAFDLDRSREETPGTQRRVKQLARESRKRRRTETLLQMRKDQEPTLPATQPAPDTRRFIQSSQPSAEYSQSQAIMSDPLQTMSQPIPGVFGRREERPKKKAKKRKGGF